MGKKIGILGSGIVAQTLARGLSKEGHTIFLGTRDPQKLASLQAEIPELLVGSFAECARFGEILILAVKGTNAEEAIDTIGAGNLAGKTVLDATNPIADSPPINGVLQFFTGPNDSLLERLQRKAPEARFVKALSCVGNHFMVRPDLPGGPPTMFICGNHEGARREAGEFLTSIGWEVADMGSAEAARAIEPLCMLWCIPGIRERSWMHAFKLLRK